MTTISRRSTLRLAASSALAGLAVPSISRAAEKSVTVGIDLSLTGADADTAVRIKDGFLMAIDEANVKGGPAGYHINVLLLDDGTATAGQYDPAQAAVNVRKMVADKACVAALGPMSSTPGKAMSPIFSQGGLATITPTSTNPDITDPKFAGLYRPAGKAVYFRTVTTDAYQGPNLANYFADAIKVKTMYGLDDSGAYGIGISTAFENRAAKKGIKVLGHDRLDPKAADYTAALTKIKGLNPDLIYYGGDAQAGVKLAKQSYDIDAEDAESWRRWHVWAVGPVRRRLPRRERMVCNGRQPAHDPARHTGAMGQALRGQVQPAAVGLLDHRVRRRVGCARRDRAGGEDRQAGDTRGSARCHPGNQAEDAARRGFVRR